MHIHKYMRVYAWCIDDFNRINAKINTWTILCHHPIPSNAAKARWARNEIPDHRILRLHFDITNYFDGWQVSRNIAIQINLAARHGIDIDRVLIVVGRCEYDKTIPTARALLSHTLSLSLFLYFCLSSPFSFKYYR